MTIRQREIPFIASPYAGVDNLSIDAENNFTVYHNPDAMLTPRVRKIWVNNYAGTITLLAEHAYKVRWFGDGKLVKSKFIVCGRFIKEFDVENLLCKTLVF